MNSIPNNNCTSFWESTEFFKLNPRLNRIKHLGLFSFWLGMVLFPIILCEILQFSNPIKVTVACFSLIGITNIIALKVRRFHDFNFSAWWLLLFLIPILNIVLAFAIFLIPGTRGSNNFGEEQFCTHKYHYMMILTTPLVFLLAALIK